MQPRPDPRDVVLPPIPAKRYFTIGEVSELCAVKPHVLRYWEQEFTQLRPMKRRGNRRYYQHHEVLLVRRIRDLLYGQGFTINGARNRLAEGGARGRAATEPGWLGGAEDGSDADSTAELATVEAGVVSSITALGRTRGPAGRSQAGAGHLVGAAPPSVALRSETTIVADPVPAAADAAGAAPLRQERAAALDRVRAELEEALELLRVLV